MYAPYIEQMKQFQPKFEAVKDVAQQERLQNVNLRQIASSVLSNEATQRRLDISERTQTERERANLSNEEIRRKRAEIYAFKAQNPNFIFRTREDGQVIAINPQNPSQTIDTGIKSGELSDLDKINLGLGAALERIEAQGQEIRKTEEARQGNRVDLEYLRQTGRIKLLDERVARGLTGETLESQTQLQQRWENNARRLIQQNPEYADWIEIDPNTGYPEITAEGSKKGFSILGNQRILDKTIRDKIVKEVFGTGTPGVVRRTAPVTSSTTKLSSNKGTIKVKAPDGRTGTWDLSKGPIPEGFTEIK